MLATGTTKVALSRDTPMVGFRVTQEERAELHYLAARLGMTVSALIRESLAYRQQQEEEKASKAAKA